MPREMRILYFFGRMPTARGTILEIGSYQGRSTIVLAKAAVAAGESFIHACDPLNSPAETDPDLQGASSIEPVFRASLAAQGVSEHVILHKQLSFELARTWDQPLRLLWHDGDHTYAGAKRDFREFIRHLQPGGIIAMHDVLHQFEGNLRVFIEDMLLSDDFGPVGCCGSVGWGQRVATIAEAIPYRKLKLRLFRKMINLVPGLAFGQKLRGLKKGRWTLAYNSVPHDEPRYDQLAVTLAKHASLGSAGR